MSTSVIEAFRKTTDNVALGLPRSTYFKRLKAASIERYLPAQDRNLLKTLERVIIVTFGLAGMGRSDPVAAAGGPRGRWSRRSLDILPMDSRPTASLSSCRDVPARTRSRS
ncbi:hypothetical protein [Rhodococcus marinonascens]|uniref:hypothetical protein n=1 Tax=Rhodococcus marinonascens TaxID=38311 RepID=UPI0014763B48|nr:hypothetical protein [Rhodococcus marinonascens]